MNDDVMEMLDGATGHPMGDGGVVISQTDHEGRTQSVVLMREDLERLLAAL